ncbi:hypothetical protein [Tenacibaculum ovolyticum]|uniref:hypothetical protein n=1 Tax=Tenacibaculum ovolyticum TaxID=104270 RepID=UPI001F46ABA0|nr:hypothetical protein [Tenacibaculum ovolyticum]
MEEINNKLDEISDLTDHYLVRSKKNSDHYFEDFIKTATIIKGVTSEKEFEFWCSEKMLLKQQVFAEKTFIQYAVETSVSRYFGEKFPTDFKVETKINPNNEKDVDCQFQDNGFTFNVEVKCSDFISKEKIENKDGYKYGTVGRLPDRGKDAIETISSALDEGLTIKGESIKPHLASKNMDNNLKDFLESAHDKFDPTPKENEINILLVGCDDDRDIQNWFNYLWAEQGLFTDQSFADRDKYKNVDLVVFTNLYFKQNKYFDKTVNDCWTLDKSFNLIFGNPYRHLQKEDGIKHFMKLLPNYTEELGKYIVPGDVPEYVKNTCRISWFVKDDLEKKQGLYLFNEKE